MIMELRNISFSSFECLLHLLDFLLDNDFGFLYFRSTHLDVLTYFPLHVSDVVELYVWQFAETAVDVARKGKVDGKQSLVLRNVFFVDDEVRG